MQRSPKPTLEALETRNLLAGNVTAVVSGGDLIVRGDALANSITITQTGASQYTVTGAATTINGVAAPFVASGVTDDFDIRMFAGADNVTIGTGAATTVIPDELDIRTNGGSDSILLTRLNVGDDTDIRTNGDGDSVNIIGCTFNEEFDLCTNGGGDNVFIGSSGAIGSLFRDDVEIDLNGDNDLATISNAIFEEDFDFDFGDGNDGAGSDFFNNNTFNDDVEIDLGSGNDSLQLGNNTFRDEVEVDFGDGTDTVRTGGNRFEEEVEYDGEGGVDTYTEFAANAYLDDLEFEEVENRTFNPGTSIDDLEIDDD